MGTWTVSCSFYIDVVLLLLFFSALLTLRGSVLQNENLIPADRFRPPFTTIAFTIDAPDVDVSLTLPRWNTHRVHATEPITKLGHIGLLRVGASYHYFADVRPDSVEQLRLDFTVSPRASAIDRGDDGR